MQLDPARSARDGLSPRKQTRFIHFRVLEKVKKNSHGTSRTGRRDEHLIKWTVWRTRVPACTKRLHQAQQQTAEWWDRSPHKILIPRRVVASWVRGSELGTRDELNCPDDACLSVLTCIQPPSLWRSSCEWCTSWSAGRPLQSPGWPTEPARLQILGCWIFLDYNLEERNRGCENVFGNSLQIQN